MRLKAIVALGALFLGGILLTFGVALMGAQTELEKRNAVYLDNAIVYNYLRICQAELAGEPVPYGAEPPANFVSDDCTEIGGACTTFVSHE